MAALSIMDFISEISELRIWKIDVQPKVLDKIVAHSSPVSRVMAKLVGQF